MKLFKKKTAERGQGAPNGNQIELDIEGMTCDHCALHVQKALKQVDGVVEARVPSWKEKRAFVSVSGEVSETQLARAVEEAGYHVKEIHMKTGKGATPSNGGGREVDYDLVVIGTGGGGMGAAIRAAEMGRKVAIVEAGTIGGTCVNIGCVPSKALIRAAEAYHTAGHHPFAGLKTRAEGLDWPALIAQKDELVAELRQKKYVDVLEAYENIRLIRGRATLDAHGDVVVDGQQTLKTRKVVVATGARPKILPIDGVKEVEVLNSTTIMALKKQPASLLIIGGRAIALELGQAFARFGTKVTLLQRSPRLVPAHEPEISAGIEEALRNEGIEIFTGSTPQAIRQEKGEKVVTAMVNGETREFRAEQVLMAVGRTPNTQNMGLEAVGVELDKGGFIVVDEYLKTSNPKIYA
ncbi:MAG: FAD-binding protein, partial [Calditrichaeota bacterium]